MITVPKPLYKVERVEKGTERYYTTDVNPAKFPGVTTIIGRVLSKWILRPWVAKCVMGWTGNYLEKIAAGLTEENLWKLVDRTLTKKQIQRVVKRAKRQLRYEAAKAADIGTRAHEFFDANYMGEGRWEPTDQDIKMATNNWYEWKGSTRIRIVSGDLKCASLTHGFGGSLDAFGIDPLNDERLCIVDYKTSNHVGQEYAYQIAAYSISAKETFGLDYYPT